MPEARHDPTPPPDRDRAEREGVMAEAREAAQETEAAVTEAAETAAEEVQDTVQEAAETVAEAVDEAHEAVQEAAETAADATPGADPNVDVDAIVDRVWSRVEERLQTAGGGVEHAVDEALQAPEDVAGATGVADVLEPAAEAVRDTVPPVEEHWWYRSRQVPFLRRQR